MSFDEPRAHVPETFRQPTRIRRRSVIDLGKSPELAQEPIETLKLLEGPENALSGINIADAVKIAQRTQEELGGTVKAGYRNLKPESRITDWIIDNNLHDNWEGVIFISDSFSIGRVVNFPASKRRLITWGSYLLLIRKGDATQKPQIELDINELKPPEARRLITQSLGKTPDNWTGNLFPDPNHHKKSA